MEKFKLCFRKGLIVIAWLLIAVSAVRQEVGAVGAGDEDTGVENSPVPKELVGSWYAGREYTTAPYNPSTGVWGTPSGKGLIYIFNKDGSYTKAFQSYVSNGGCTTGFTAFESGHVSVEGNSLITTPNKGRLVYKDTCVPSLNSDKPLEELKQEEFSWELKPNENDPSILSLHLSRADGASSSFNPL